MSTKHTHTHTIFIDFHKPARQNKKSSSSSSSNASPLLGKRSIQEQQQQQQPVLYYIQMGMLLNAYLNCRTIKLSSPKLSNITAVGCILVYAAVILLGLDYSTLPATDSTFPVVCMVSASIY